MTFSHSENDTPSNLHARRAPMVVCPLGMHRITPFLIALPERTTLNETRISKPLITRYTLVLLTTKSTHSTPPIIPTARTPPLAHPTLSHATLLTTTCNVRRCITCTPKTNSAITHSALPAVPALPIRPTRPTRSPTRPGHSSHHSKPCTKPPCQPLQQPSNPPHVP